MLANEPQYNNCHVFTSSMEIVEFINRMNCVYYNVTCFIHILNFEKSCSIFIPISCWNILSFKNGLVAISNPIPK